MPSVLALTDDSILELGLRALFQANGEFDLVSTCRLRNEFINAAQGLQPDLVIYGLATDPDLNMVCELRRVAPAATPVVWTREISSEMAHRAIQIGVRGFVCPTVPVDIFLECLRSAAQGRLWMEKSLSMQLLNNRPISLSRRQSQLLGLLVQGLKNKEIAHTLGIREGTVKAYLTALFEKVGARDRFELALYGFKNLRYLQGAGGEETSPALAESFAQSGRTNRKPAGIARGTAVGSRAHPARKASGWPS